MEKTRLSGSRDGRAGADVRGDGPVRTFIKGILVGIANIIPGVSGGTFALILGIFDRLVAAINAVGLRTARAVLRVVAGGFSAGRRREFAGEWRRVDGRFLTVLIAGAAAAVLSSSFLIEWLLEAHWSPTLAFFVGLILPSVAVPWGMMDRRGAALLWIVPGAALTVGVSLLMPDGGAGSANLAAAAATGALAVSAMILPGISGSFIMLVLGQYQTMLDKLTGLQRGLAEGRVEAGALLWLGALGLGMLVGLLAFARLLDFLLKRFKAATMAFLIGLLLGSLWVLWPFKDIAAGAAVAGREGEVKQEIRIATAPNRLPASLEEGLIGGGAFLAGLAGSAGLIALGRRRDGARTAA